MTAPIRRPKFGRSLLICLAAAVVLAGCGGGDSEPDTAVGATPTASISAAPMKISLGTASALPLAAGPTRLLFAGPTGLWSADLDGTGVRRLLKRSEFQGLAVSSDGRTLAFGDDGLWVAGIDGTGPRLIDKETLGDPVFSPDGRTIAMLRGDGDGASIFAIKPDGTELRRLTTGKYASVAFHPDGSRVVVMTVRALETVPIDGGRPTPLIAAEGMIHHATYSPDGRGLAFAIDLGVLTWEADLYRANADGTDRRRLTTTSDAYVPDWSPDSKRIVFHRATADSDGRKNAGVWGIDADGSNLRRLSKEGADPQFSPDGRHIAFARDSGLYVMRADGSKPTMVARGEIHYFAFVPVSG